MTAPITGRDLNAWGYKPGPLFPTMMDVATAMRRDGCGDDAIRACMDNLVPAPIQTVPLQDNPGAVFVNLDRGTTPDSVANHDAVLGVMQRIMWTPHIVAGSVMPDACPTGPDSIPVGGVVLSRRIHPGFHSADVCCSVAMTIFGDVDPADVLDRVHAVTHFGPTARPEAKGLIPLSANLVQHIEQNRFTQPFLHKAARDMGTQGDGNHFAFVGRLRSSGDVALVTHHGSRSFGAAIYKAGMAAAEADRRKHSPETSKGCAWIEDERTAEDYWEALQIARLWTLENHMAIHLGVDLPMKDFHWNEHNFVFRRSNGLFYHGKGATPAWSDWPVTLVPLNMAEPVLITKGRDNPRSLGFSPHGAGREWSRTEHLRRGVADLERETQGLDVRFYMGIPDASELPSAYKNAADVRRQMTHYGLADVVDEVVPYGCIMAGDWEQDAPWKRKRIKATQEVTA